MTTHISNSPPYRMGETHLWGWKMTTHTSNRPPYRVGESHLFVRFANGNTGLVPLGGTLFTAEPGTGHTTCWDGVQDDPNGLDQPAVLDHPLTDVINAINGE